jgi:hypothetical protein
MYRRRGLAETIINTLFGYIPKLDRPPTLVEPYSSRRFTGELLHVRYGNDQFAIRCDNAGLNLRKEANARSRYHIRREKTHCP